MRDTGGSRTVTAWGRVRQRPSASGGLTRFHSGGLTLVEVLVVIAIIGLLMGLLLPGIQAVREVVRMTACQHNLRQIGQAVHQFHMAFEGFPPAVTGNTGLSFWAIILPYIDQTTVADRINYDAGVCHDSFPGEPCHSNHPSSSASTCPGGVIDDASYAAGRANWVALRTARNLNYQICPTRGYRIVRHPGFGGSGQFLANDYHMIKAGTGHRFHFSPNYGGNPTNDENLLKGNVSLFFNATTNRQVLQVAEVPPKNGLQNLNLIVLPPNNWNGQFNVNRGVKFPLDRPYANWRPRSRDAHVLDGLSNTAIVAERHLPRDSYGLCCDDVNKDNNPGGTGVIPDTDAFPHWNSGNGPFGGYGGGTMAANVDDGIARGAGEIFMRRGLGSWHPDYCNFLMADGAVKAIDIAINSQMLVSLGDAKDGVERGFILVLP
jgi:prepilin-type N-terminal cleavage/methylation domain-containing protein/prepilin-type processing-associated H-X9-DG protein